MKRLLFAFLFLLLSHSNSIFASPLILDESPQGRFVVGPSMEIQEDADGVLQFSDFKRPEIQEQFLPNAKENPNFGFTNSVYWGKFTVTNQHPQQKEWVLELNYPLIDFIDLWVPDAEGQYQKRSSGDQLPFANRELSYRNITFQIRLGAGQSKEIYYRVKTQSSMQIPLSIWTTKAFAEHINNALYGYGIYYGVMLSMILYNLFIYISVKDQSYIYYVFYILSYLLFQMSLNGLAYEYLWPNSTWWGNVAIPIMLCFSLIGAVRFAQTFLGIATGLPKINKMMWGLLGILGLCILTALFGTYAMAIRLSTAVSLLAVGFIATAGIRIWVQGYRPAAYYLFAWSSVLIGSLIFALKSFGILPTTFITSNGMQIGSALEVLLLSLGLADRINVMRKDKYLAEKDARESSQQALESLKIADQQKEENIKIIQEHSKTLEAKVSSRTKSIKDLMDNTGQGFLSFGSNYIVNKEYSKACEVIFGEGLEGQNALSLLFGANVEIEVDKLNELIDMLFTGTDIALIDALLPARVFINEKTLSVEFKVIPGETAADTKIMVILTDITKEVALAEQLRADEERQAIVVKVATDKNGFLQFLRELEELFASIQNSLIGPIEEFNIDSVMRCYHTIKGGCASYGMVKVAKVAHEIENILAPVAKGTQTIDQEILQVLRKDTGTLEEVLHNILADLNDIIPPEDRNLKQTFYRVSDEKIIKLEEFMLNRIGSEHLALIKGEIDNLIAQPLGPMLRKYATAAEELGNQLNKTVEVSIKGAEIEIPVHKFDSFFTAFIHLVRNSVDHGLEDSGMREMMGKKPQGQIRIEAELDKTDLKLTVADDGAGIDAERVSKIATEKGIITEAQAATLTAKDTYDLIFAPGFSTKEQVTDVSGRGVGMDAVKSAVEDLQGSINIQSVQDEGTTFEVRIPLGPLKVAN
ncbi:MAG: 7TM diverse intracellular signaling domain-containing protein [SAR324 cluster bacterium]|nr:7TM diverse intracellular signaling domain-containing protein [SAR324 cluster bacterium]